MPDNIQVKSVKIPRGRFRKTLGDLRSLIASIEKVGLLHPIVVSETRSLIAGRRRLEAFKKLSRRTIPAVVVSYETPKDRKIAERDENDIRLDLRPTEAVAVKKYFDDIEKKAAKERQREAGKKHGRGKPKKGGAKLAQAKSRDKVAARTGYGRTTLEKAEAVVDAAEENPELAHVVDKMDETGKVDPAYKAVTKKGSSKRRVSKLDGIKSACAFLTKKQLLSLKAWLTEFIKDYDKA
jgi:ParB-like chromosome segregation protein Spo0J